MTRVVLDASLRTKLLDLTQPLEICDDAGRMLGHFIPFLDSTKNGEPQLDEKELQRRDQEPDYSTAEVLAYLEKL